MEVFSVGEKLHIVEKRMFADDIRRHFIGEIRSFSSNAIRVFGYVWVYNATQGKFIRRNEKRERVIILGDRIIINILPSNLNLQEVVYNTENMKKMFITNGRDFSLELSEFVTT